MIIFIIDFNIDYVCCVGPLSVGLFSISCYISGIFFNGHLLNIIYNEHSSAFRSFSIKHRQHFTRHKLCECVWCIFFFLTDTDADADASDTCNFYKL